MSWIIYIAGKKYGSEYLGIKETDKVAIDRNIRRVIKSSDEGETWEIVDTPENHGMPSIAIQYLDK